MVQRCSDASMPKEKAGRKLCLFWFTSNASFFQMITVITITDYFFAVLIDFPLLGILLDYYIGILFH